MKDLPRILSAYVELDAILEEEIDRTPVSVQVQARQVLDDQAYFLLCWGQLEIEIDAKCRDAVRWRRRHPDWQIRRAWDSYNPDDKCFSGLVFEDRVKLVLDGNGGRANPYAVTMKNYSIRNEMAHGRLRSTRIEVGAFVQDRFVIQAALHRAT